MKKIGEMVENKCSFAFSTDGLDGRDADRSSIYDFTVYFYDKNEICSEVVYVKGLQCPYTGEVISATKLDEGEKYLTLSSIIPMLTVLREKARTIALE